jgi:hypothetical protein
MDVMKAAVIYAGLPNDTVGVSDNNENIFRNTRVHIIAVSDPSMQPVLSEAEVFRMTKQGHYDSRHSCNLSLNNNN